MTTSSAAQPLRLYGSRGQYTGHDESASFTAMICKQPGAARYLARCWVQRDQVKDVMDREFKTFTAAHNFIQRNYRAQVEGCRNV